MRKQNTRNYRIKLSIVFIAIFGLLSINQSFADSSDRDDNEYRGGHHSSNNKYRSSRSRDYPRHNRYIMNKHHNPRHYGTHPRHYNSRPRHANYRYWHPRNEHYSTYYTSSVSYSDHNDAATTIIGSAIGGVIANDISRGDGAATAIGILTGAVVANELAH